MGLALATAVLVVPEATVQLPAPIFYQISHQQSRKSLPGSDDPGGTVADD
jgi:hypothetical protein